MDFMTYYKQISSGTINKVAVFTGNELYNIEHTIRYIEDHFLNPSYSEFNMVKIENTFDLDSFLSVASTMPFFDERRIVLINNTNVLKQIKDQQAPAGVPKLAQNWTEKPSQRA